MPKIKPKQSMRPSRNLTLIAMLVANVFMTGCGPSTRETKLESELAELNLKIEATSAIQQSEHQTAIKELAVAKSKVANLEEALLQARLQIDNFTKEKLLRAEPKEHVVKGDVFIVTKGGESFRLGLVGVSLLNEEVLVEHLTKRKSEATELAAKLGKTLVQQGELLARKNGESKTLEAKSKTAFHTLLDNITSDRLKELDKAARSAYEAARDAALNLQVEVFDLQSQIRRLKSAPFYFEVLPPAFKTGKTNAEGQFSIILDAESSTSKVWLAASASRSVGKSQEDYFWLVPLKRSPNSASTVVSLNNDNMTNTESEIFKHLQK